MTSFPDEDTLFRVITCLANEGYKVNNVLQTNKAFWWDEQIWDAMKNKCGPSGMTPLMYNAWKGNTERVAWLLKRTPNLEARLRGTYTIDFRYTIRRYPKGLTAFSIACIQGHLEVAQLLQKNGAQLDGINHNITVLEGDSYTPIMLAINNGHHDLVKWLAPFVNLEEKTRDSRTALTLAVMNGDERMVKDLCDAGANIDTPGIFTPLIYALDRGFVNIVKELLRRGANVNVDKPYSNAPLHNAIRNGYPEIVKQLCLAGADVNYVTMKDGYTALMSATDKNCLETLKELCKRGAHLDARHSGTTTALLKACMSGNIDIAMELIRAGADVNLADYGGETPLLWAVKWGHLGLVKELCYAGANLNATVTHDSYFRKLGRFYRGDTPLLVAAEEPDVEVKKFLSEWVEQSS
jgi:ankyrin repeat protein